MPPGLAFGAKTTSWSRLYKQKSVGSVKQSVEVEMIAAARTSAFHYKKRPTPTAKVTGKKNARASPNASTGVSPASSYLSLGSRNSLSVPSCPMRKRSGSVPALKITTLATEWGFKTTQVRALRTTWARLCEPPRSNCKGIVNLVERIWDKLDAKDPNVKNIFYHAAFVDSMHDRCERRSSQTSIATIHDHTHFFVSLVSQTIQNLENDPYDILAHIDVVGRKHAFLKQYGLKSSHWEKVGEYFIDIVVIQDCVRAFPEACRAWTQLIAAIIDRLRAAPRRSSISPAISKEKLTSSNQSINLYIDGKHDSSQERIDEDNSRNNGGRKLSHASSASDILQKGTAAIAPTETSTTMNDKLHHADTLSQIDVVALKTGRLALA